MILHKCPSRDIERKRILETLESQRLVALSLQKVAGYEDFSITEHLSRVQSICWILAYRAKSTLYNKLDWEDVVDIALAGELHDIGKIGVPKKILNKPGKLNELEFECIKKHVNIGVGIIDNLIKIYPNNKYFIIGREMIAYHHERWDGGGYPNKLKGEKIPLSSRICAIADVYDALREERPYKPSYTHEESVEIIKNGRSTQFDPDLTDIFLIYNKEIEIACDTSTGISIMDTIIPVN